MSVSSFITSDGRANANHHVWKITACDSAIGCFRASPYGGIYILKHYSKLTAKKIQFFCLKPSPDQDGTNKKNFSN